MSKTSHESGRFSDFHGALTVGNAVPGVPSGAMRKQRARKRCRIAAFGGRNAGDGIPYG